MKVYTYNYDTAEVVERECEAFGYPHACSNGETMFENTHFRTPAEARDALVSNIEAGLRLDADERSRARQAFEAATARLADTAEKLAKVRRGEAPCEAEPGGGMVDAVERARQIAAGS